METINIITAYALGTLVVTFVFVVLVVWQLIKSEPELQGEGHRD